MIASTFRGRVSAEGKLVLNDDAKRRLKVWMGSLAGEDVDFVIRKYRANRSTAQNAWVWGVAYPLIAEHVGYDRHEIDDLHYALVAKCFGTHVDERLGTDVPNARSSKLTTKQFSDYMEWLVRFAAQELGVVIPLPDEAEVAA